MSTMLKTAAMSLLSKTLQTFLYKYLEDVDVEGINLPSVYDGSWGLRLSNVKLRKGVKLIKRLPGGRKRKQKRTKKRSTRTSKEDFGGSVDQSDEASIQLEQLTVDETTTEDVTQSEQQQSNSRSLDMSASSHLDEQDETSTPVQHGSRTFFTNCFSSSRSNVKTQPTQSTHSSERSLPETLPLDDASQGAGPLSPVQEDIEKNTQPRVRRSHFNSKVEEDEDDDDNESEDEEEEYDQPMQVCIGENGKIGTLDIRFLGKELHVMVEDAILTIEASPILDSGESDDADGDNQDQSDGTHAMEANTDNPDSTTPKSTSAPGTASDDKGETTTENEKAAPKRDTVGDRVLADNPIARLVSAIPHLFLRDVRVRFIIRDDADGVESTPTTDNEMGTEEASAMVENKQNSPSGQGEKLREELNASRRIATVDDDDRPSEKPLMVEVGIDFLSVTSGGDILSHFQEENQDEADTDSRRIPADIPKYANIERPGSSDTNMYMNRHIRTGRGPEAGIWVQLFVPDPKPPTRNAISDASHDILWARQRWVLATDFYLLRCSGIDIRARVHLGTKAEVSSYYSWFDFEQEDWEYDEETLDSILPGFDYVAPGPQLPLPPMRPPTPAPPVQPFQPSNDIAAEGGPEKVGALHPGVDVYFKDKHDIQSCKLPSSFHRISRGMMPTSNKCCNHLPSEICTSCWQHQDGSRSRSQLDNSLPMPGLALQFSLRDPLEVNVDRFSVDVIGLLKDMFVKPKASSTPKSNDDDIETKDNPEDTPAQDDSTKATTRTSMFSFLSRKGIELEKDFDSSDAFSPFMQPENIQVMGVHVSELSFRVHIMKSDLADQGHSFWYWDLSVGCATVDHQSLNSVEKKANDTKFDVGFIILDEYRGIHHQKLATFGMPFPARERADSGASLATLQSMIVDHMYNKTPWPSTACALLDIPPPLETMVYKERERHGLQLRYVTVATPNSPNSNDIRSQLHVRLGLSSVTAPWRFWNDITETRLYTMKTILGQSPPATDSSSTKRNSPPPKTTKSLMSYAFQCDGGQLTMRPLIKTELPLSRVDGEISSDAGVYMETILEKIQVEYGKRSKQGRTTTGMLSLPQLAALPESVRMRILFCLKDLKPLEQALDVKQEVNPFKRTRAVNKGILKLSKRLVKEAAKSKSKTHKGKELPEEESSQTERQGIMSEILRMDNKELHEMWSVHQRHQRRQAKKKASNIVSFTTTTP